MTLRRRETYPGQVQAYRLTGLNNSGNAAATMDLAVQGPDEIGVWLVGLADIPLPGNSAYGSSPYVQVRASDLAGFLRAEGFVPEDPEVKNAKVNALALILDNALQSGDSFHVTAARLLRTGQVDIPDVPNV